MVYFAIGLPIAILIRLFAGVPLFWFIVIPITILTFIGIAKMDETSILAARKFKDGKSIDSLAMAKKYYEEFGNLNIPVNYLTSNGKKLSDWIIRQRRNYKLGKMPLEHKEKLDEIGFIWDLGNTWTNSTHISASITY